MTFPRFYGCGNRTRDFLRGTDSDWQVCGDRRTTGRTGPGWHGPAGSGAGERVGLKGQVSRRPLLWKLEPVQAPGPGVAATFGEMWRTDIGRLGDESTTNLLPYCWSKIDVQGSLLCYSKTVFVNSFELVVSITAVATMSLYFFKPRQKNYKNFF